MAQTRTVTGTIRDEKGEPVPFATITEAGTTNAAQADAAGVFSITVKEGARLNITSSGFTAQTLPALGDLSSITLARSGEQLSEVIVTTALGIRRPAKELGYATARVSNALLTQGRAVNLQQGLAGKVSGVNITTVNSGVFEDTRVNFRGIRSLTGNNEPLMVVDGIPTPLAYISTINPNDVQDVNVLKGASASALYGPDGVNGVMLITTRRGSNKPFVNVRQTVQLTRVSFLPKMQTRFGSGSGEDAFGRPLYDPIENQQFGPEFNGELVELGPHLEDDDVQKVTYSARPDEKRKFWNNGLTLQTDVSFGGKDFYVSAQNAEIKGLMPKDKNRRTSFRINSSKEYGKLKASVSLNYIQSNFNVVNDAAYASRFASSYNGSVYFTVLNTPMQIPLTSYKDWRNNKYAQYSNYYNEYFVNPYWAIDNHRNIGRSDNLLGALDVNYTVAKWLNATYRIGTSLSYSNFKNETYPIVTTQWAQDNRGQGFDAQPGFVQDGQNMNGRLTHEFFLNGKQDLSDFRFNYIAGIRYRTNSGKNLNASGNNLVVPYLFNLSNRSGVAVAFENNFKSRLLSLFGQVGVSYKGWANLEFSAANDWDSRLDINRNSYFYPGVAGSVVLTDAIPNLKGNTVSYAKIRGSVSKSANVNLGPYQLESIYNQTGGFPYGNLGGFSALNTITNPLIEPEFVNSKEAGIELGLLRNRINLDATYFFQKNTNQILQVQQSSSTGYPSYFTNTADFNNYGIELDLNLTPLVKIGKGRIDFEVNATYNNNKVTSLFPGINELAIGGSNEFVQLAASSPDAYNYAIVGQPAFVFKLSDYARDPQGRVIVDRITGDPRLEDSLVIRGRSLPLWIIGVNPSFTLGGFSISMTWDYKGGHYAYHGIGSDMDFTGISARSAQFGRERFVFPNSVYDDGTGKYVPNDNIQVSNGGRNFWATGSTNTSIATNYFSSAASWKLRELEISYDLPFKWLGDTKVIKGITVSAVGRNLLTFLPKSNQWADPEFNYTTANNTFGISSVFSVPPSRLFGGSINFTF
ncbi:MAG TPA: SusC/RagA family TonB-linked outer membrane protein [Niastella sp.]|nr:SusC/RagA family TonB-linked outer membrane protein [Niastella sp.]